MTTIIELTEEFVRQRLKTEATGHDWWHMVRVVNIARTLHAEEGGDWKIIHLTLLLHDVGDRKVLGTDEDDYSIAENFLMEQRLDPETIQIIMTIIQTMSFSKSFDSSVSAPSSVEFQIVQDADRLDAMGAIGIARAFAYGGNRGRLLYDPDYTPQEFATTKDYRTATSSTLHHFDEKLFSLKDLLNTNTARRLAEDRDRYMHEFYTQFLKEWDGTV